MQFQQQNDCVWLICEVSYSKQFKQSGPGANSENKEAELLPLPVMKCYFSNENGLGSFLGRMSFWAHAHNRHIGHILRSLPPDFVNIYKNDCEKKTLRRKFKQTLTWSQGNELSLQSIKTYIRNAFDYRSAVIVNLAQKTYIFKLLYKHCFTFLISSCKS